MTSVAALGRQAGELCLFSCQLGLHSEFQGSQGYIVSEGLIFYKRIVAGAHAFNPGRGRLISVSPRPA